MADIAPKLIHLSAEELLALHSNVHKSASPSSAEIEVHHTVLNEMARRKMERPKDDWDKYEILIDSIDDVDLTSIAGLPAETVLEVIKSTGETVGNIKTFFTVNGYQMRIESVAKAEDSFAPPQSVRDAAQRAIEWIDGGLAGGGSLTMDRASTTSYEVGLPFTVSIVTLPIEPRLQAGARTGFVKRIVEVNAILYQTQHIVVNTNLVPIRTLDTASIMDNDVPEFTGTKLISGISGYDQDAQITITQTLPLKLNLLGMEYKISVYGGT